MATVDAEIRHLLDEVAATTGSESAATAGKLLTAVSKRKAERVASIERLKTELAEIQARRAEVETQLAAVEALLATSRAKVAQAQIQAVESVASKLLEYKSHFANADDPLRIDLADGNILIVDLDGSMRVAEEESAPGE